MADPYEILGLPRDAGLEQIRKRYLELVREFPPDRSPERFTSIRAAYDELRDPVHRVSNLLFGVQSTDSIDALNADLRARLRAARIPVKTLLSLADASR
jgi:DnaJ-class molecular chaperone